MTELLHRIFCVQFAGTSRATGGLKKVAAHSDKKPKGRKAR